MTRTKSTDKPFRCIKCEKFSLDLTFYKKEWICDACMNKDEKGCETSLKDHMYKSGSLSWIS
ncbi:MAG: hypothetical protein DRP01_08895 [Archaeoglobales archaeon]|nr:MAG: hypothetical protein DRP01_08895 [Archaeoglobales archaeon]